MTTDAPAASAAAAEAPAGAPMPLLPPDICQALSARLSSLPDLPLPAHMQRDRLPPDTAEIASHLIGLLTRDPAVFLERYGTQLLPEELQPFEALRQGSYEVDFYLTKITASTQHGNQRHLEQQQRHQQQRHQQGCSAASTVAKNRRLAFMRRLEQQGEFFSQEAMRAREPLIWHEHIGRFEGEPPPPPPPMPGNGFAGSLLQAHDEALLRARLQQQLEEEECQMSEQESDSDPDDEAAAAAAAAAAGAGRSSTGGGNAASGQQQQGQQQRTDMSRAAMQQRRQEFLSEMQSRFLLGFEGQHQRYESIDADATLDDDWAAQAAQDAQDAYFDAD